MNYVVGQVLYAVFKRESKVIPVRVVEEITRKTLEGLRVDYTVQAGPSDESNISLEALAKECEVFDSPSQVIETLTDRAKSSITRLVSAATQKSEAWYGGQGDSQGFQQEQPARNAAQEHVNVVLPDGTVARAKMPKAV